MLYVWTKRKFCKSSVSRQKGMKYILMTRAVVDRSISKKRLGIKKKKKTKKVFGSWPMTRKFSPTLLEETRGREKLERKNLLQGDPSSHYSFASAAAAAVWLKTKKKKRDIGDFLLCFLIVPSNNNRNKFANSC